MLQLIEPSVTRQLILDDGWRGFVTDLMQKATVRRSRCLVYCIDERVSRERLGKIGYAACIDRSLAYHFGVIARDENDRQGIAGFKQLPAKVDT
jgi:hypothetical protein